MGEPSNPRRTWTLSALALSALVLAGVAHDRLRPSAPSSPSAAGALAPPPQTEVTPHLEDDAALTELVLREARSLVREGTPTGRADAIELLEAVRRRVLPGKLPPALWSELRLELGRLRLAQGQLEVAQRLFVAVLKDDPKHVDARLALTEALERRGRRAEALRVVQRARTIAPRDVRVLVLLGELRLAGGKIDQALALFQRAVEIQEDHAAAYVGLGRAQLKLGQFGEAQDNLTEAIDIQPSSPVGYDHRGRLHLARFRLDQALQDFQVALRRDPGYAPALVGLGRVHELRGDDVSAERRFRQAAQDPRTAGEALARLARLQLWRADPIQASAEGRSPAQRAASARQAREALAAARLESPTNPLVVWVASRLANDRPRPAGVAKKKPATVDDGWGDSGGARPRQTEAEYLLAQGRRFHRLAQQSPQATYRRSAERALSLAWTLDPTSADALLEFAHMNSDTDRAGAALAAARRAVAIDPMRAEGHLLIARLVGRTSSSPVFHSEARLAIETAVGAATGPKVRIAALFAQAQLQRSEGDEPQHLRAARATLAQAAALIPQTPTSFELPTRVARRWSEVCRRLGDAAGVAEALAALERLEAQRRTQIKAALQEAATLRARLNYSGSIEALDRVLRLDPAHAEALSLRGVCYLKIGNFVPGILDYSRAVEIDPRWSTGEPLRVTTQCVFVSPARAIAEINTIVADHPNKAYVIFLRASMRTFGFVNGFTLADPIGLGIADLDRTLRLNPVHVLALSYRAYLRAHAASAVFDPLRRAELFERALADLRRATRIAPEFGLSHYLTAYVSVLRGAFEPQAFPGAVTALERAAALGFPCRRYLEENRAFDPIRKLPAVQRLLEDG